MKPSFKLSKNTKQYNFVINGPDTLSDTDILKLVCGDNISVSLCDVKDKDYYDLKNLGLTNLQALRLLASFQLKKRCDIINDDSFKISCSSDIFNIMSPYLSDISHEEFHVIFMNRSNKVIAKKKISQGGLAGTVVDTRIILKTAINLYASSIIAVHNHPSNNTSPSQADISLTNKLKESALLMEIQLLDHVIIAGNKYYSFADEGIL